MEDIARGKPYFVELERRKKEGELFFTYYFKKMATDRIEGKIIFAKLYESFCWIVAMGVYTDSIEEYILADRKETNAQKRVALNLVGPVNS